MSDGPTLAERIRRHASDHYVGPARRAQGRTVTIRAGDVHRDLGLTSRAPAVCGALRSRLFQQLAGVTLLERVGPPQSTTTRFRYRLESHSGDGVDHRVARTAQPSPRPANARRVSAASQSESARAADVATGRRLFLVSCVKTKLAEPAAAKDIYVSDWFRKHEPASNVRAGRGASCRPSMAWSTPTT